MVNINWLRRKIGDALWLWQLLNGAIKFDAQEQWLLVAEGKPVSDADIGSRLFCDGDTVKLWRERLESVGLVRSTVLPDKDAFGLETRKYEVVNLGFGEATATAPLGSTAVH